MRPPVLRSLGRTGFNRGKKINHDRGTTPMPIAYPEILSLTSEPQAFAWTEKETMLYALGIGLGNDPMNEQELPFVYESGLKAVPTMATTVAWGAGPSMGKMGINFLLVVHGEQKVEFHKTFPTEASVLAEGRIIGAYDKGDKGAVIYNETVLKDAKTGEKIATLTGSTFARGDGNFGGPSDGAPEAHEVPTRSPDMTVDIPTKPDQALIYRAVLQAYADFDPSRIKSHQVRFSSPVFPGETISVDLWKDGDVVSFEARVKDRGVTVVKNGKTVLG